MKAQPRFFDPEGAILAGQIGVAEDLPQWFSVNKKMSSPQKVLGGVIHVAIDHEFFVDVPGQKRVVADKRLRGKVGHPSGLHGRLPAAAGLAARLPGDGTADDHPFAGRGFVSDHGIRPGTTAPRADALPINSLVDNDLFAGLEDLRRAADRPKRLFAAAGVRVGRLRVLAGDMVGRPVVRLIVPEGKHHPVGEHRLIPCRERRREDGANRYRQGHRLAPRSLVRSLLQRPRIRNHVAFSPYGFQSLVHTRLDPSGFLQVAESAPAAEKCQASHPTSSRPPQFPAGPAPGGSFPCQLGFRLRRLHLLSPVLRRAHRPLVQHAPRVAREPTP